MPALWFSFSTIAGPYFVIHGFSLVLALVAAWCATGTALRRRIAIVIGVCSMLPTWLLPSSPPVVRAVCALVTFTWVMRIVDLSRVSFSFPRRALHVLTVVDTRRLTRRAPRFAMGAFLMTLVWATLAALGVFYLMHTRDSPQRLFPVDRWLAGDLAVYSVVSGMYTLLTWGYSAIGFQTPPLHISPILARTVAELWGERWARPISDWLGDTFFRPYARRRRPLTGVLLAFMVSAGFHAYGIWVGLGFFCGALPAALTFGYFLVQGLIMALERKLEVRAWSPIAGHLWTVVWMLAVSPLFIGPIIRLLGL